MSECVLLIQKILMGCFGADTTI